jgi:hypothetical protein
VGVPDDGRRGNKRKIAVGTNSINDTEKHFQRQASRVRREERREERDLMLLTGEDTRR